MTANRCGNTSRVLTFARLLLLLLAGASGPVTASSAGGWSETASRVLTSLPTALGVLPSGQRMQVVLGLKLPDAAAVAARVERMRTPGDVLYGRPMTPARFATDFAPTQAQAQSVVDYLVGMGFDNVQVAPGNRLLVSADAPVSVIEAAFNTRVMRFPGNGRTRFANIRDAQVPAALRGTVLAVLGLQNLVEAHPPAQIAAAATPTQGTLTPPEFATAYDAVSVPPATDTTVAIFMNGDLTQVLNDFRLANDQNHLPQVPVDIVQVGSAGSDTHNALEWSLDSQSALGMAGDLKSMIWYQTATLNNSDLLLAFNRWVTDDRAQTADASFGECETDAQSSGFIMMADQILMQAVAQGQTLFVASGDAGSVCPQAQVGSAPVGQRAVNYPGSSPYAVAVGGTTLLTDSAAGYGSESVWSNSGGGGSAIEPIPSWQKPVVPTLLNLLPATYKGVPDISMDGNPDTGARVIVDGQLMALGGTSLSAPLAMGAWARLETAAGNQLGFAAPLLYAQASGSGIAASGFHDIISGSNGLNFAGAGWDYASGLGSFDVAALLPLLSAGASSTAGSSDGGTSATTSNAAANSGGGGAALPAWLGVLVLMTRWRRRRMA